MRGLVPGEDDFLYTIADSGAVFRTFHPVTAVQEAGSPIPASFALERNYPNPFNPSTVISYQLPVASDVKLVVFDVLGREVATIVDGLEEPGHKSVEWNAGGVASGVYFYQLQARDFVQTLKLLLLR